MPIKEFKTFSKTSPHATVYINLMNKSIISMCYIETLCLLYIDALLIGERLVLKVLYSYLTHLF